MPSIGQVAFWDSFLKAVEVEPRDVQNIIGASGLDHEILALGVDDKAKRIVIVSKEHDSKAAAMMQMDIQTAHPGVHVLGCELT